MATPVVTNRRDSGALRGGPGDTLAGGIWRPTLIGVDCDGVLASDRLLWQRMRERFPGHIPARYEDLATFDWPRATDETTALCLELSADPEFAGLLDPMPRMAESLRRLRERGYRIRMITARPDCVRAATRRWLRRHGVSHCVEEIHCVPSGLDKVPLALRLGCAAFVEDNHATAEALGAAGIRSYLLDAPYNRLPTANSLRMRGWRALLADLTERVPALTVSPRPAGRSARRANRIWALPATLAPDGAVAVAGAGLAS